MEGKLDNTQKVVYVAELDQDIDDIIAAEYLFRQNVLKEVVLAPFPKDKLGKQRLRLLQDQGIKVSDSISDGAEIVFIGGALTAVAKYISNNKGIKLLVMNGGFVGKNLVGYNEILPKFKNKEFVRTFNFNIDVRSTDIVMRSTTEQIGKIVLVGKNVVTTTETLNWAYGTKDLQENFWTSSEFVTKRSNTTCWLVTRV